MQSQQQQEMPSETPHSPDAVVRVGVGVLVQDPRQSTHVFCGLRRGSHGAGTLALPGGHLELYESWTACAQREVMEEMGLNIVVVSCSSENDENETSSSSSCSLAHVTNDIMTAEGKHYVTLFVMAKCQDLAAVPQNCEPHKCEGWHSYSWSELQELWALQQQQQQGDEDDDPGNNTITTTATTTTTTTTTTTLPRLFGPLAQLVADNPETVRRFLSSSHA